MAITAVSGQLIATSGTSATAISGTLPAPPTPGNLLVAQVCCAGAVTPTATGAWTKLTQIQSTDTGALFWKIVPASDPALQTLTSAGTGSSWGVVIQEFAGATASPLLVQNNQASTTTSKASPSVSPTASVEVLLVGGAFSDGARTWSTSAFTGTNVGTVTNVGTGSRGTTAAGESATLWYAQISSTTGAYAGTITCSAADGGGAAVAVFLAAPARSIAGAQPSGSGGLTRVHNRALALSGSQPVLVAVLYDDPTVDYDQIDIYYDGRSPGTVTAEEAVGAHYDRTVAGAQPTATGTLTRRLIALRSLAGAAPTALGTLARALSARRSAAGAQPTAAGTLTRRLAALRSLAGAQPSGTATLTRRLAALRSLAGAQPAAAAILSEVRATSRAVAGAQPTAAGTLTRRLAALRSLVGAAASGLGTLVRQIAVFRSLSGAMPPPSGSLGNDASLDRGAEGVMPAASGTLGVQSAVHRTVAGLQPTALGTLAMLSAFARAVTGAQPTATGTLVRRLAAFRSVLGTQSSPAGTLARLFATSRQGAGTQPAPTGTLATSVGRQAALTGTQPAPTGTVLAALYGPAIAVRSLGYTTTSEQGLREQVAMVSSSVSSTSVGHTAETVLTSTTNGQIRELVTSVRDD